MLSLSLALGLLVQPLAGRPMRAEVLALRGATLIDGTDRPPLANATVVMSGGWIVAVGPASTTAIPKGARVVDLPGRYLLPGFIDMHAHLAIAGWEIDSTDGKRTFRFPYDEIATQEVSRNQLAFGITTIRNPAGPTPESVSLRNRIRMGQLDGPRVFTAGWPIDRVALTGQGVSATTEAQVRAEVRRQGDAGVDFVKLYAGLDLPLVKAGIDEAHRLGLKAVGHLWQTSWTDAAGAGIDGIVHIAPGNAYLLPVDQRAAYQRSFRGTQFMFDWFRFVDLDGPEITAMIDALVAHRVTIDPTLVAFEAIARANDSGYARESRRLDPPSLASKMSGVQLLTLGWKPADFDSARANLPRMQALAKRLFDAGVLLTVGTDFANPWFYARELELMVGAGIPVAEVLKMATRNGAMALGASSEFGTIEPGKRADVVVLSASPLADVGNARRVEWVVQAGRMAVAAHWLPARLGRATR